MQGFASWLPDCLEMIGGMVYVPEGMWMIDEQTAYSRICQLSRTSDLNACVTLARDTPSRRAS
jgi:hypothetical protein